MPDATLRAVSLAKEHGVPVVLTLGTRFVIAERPEFWRSFIAENVDVLAMNEEEGEALTGVADPLLACERALDWADLVLCTAGPTGLYLAGYTDDAVKRETRYPLLPGAIPEFNRYEFSRPMRAAAVHEPASRCSLTSRRTTAAPRASRAPTAPATPRSPRSSTTCPRTATTARACRTPPSTFASSSTYSSMSQVCRYANRVSYEVLAQSSPRLTRGLPGARGRPRRRGVLGALSAPRAPLYLVSGLSVRAGARATRSSRAVTGSALLAFCQSRRTSA